MLVHERVQAKFMDFHTIKSILNLDFWGNIYILGGDFHTIKSILNAG